MLTPDSTGSSPDSSGPSAKRTRRQTFNPTMNPSNKPQKPFSRSAAKRDSVMALGSIEHLQHYFTKTGIAAKQNPLSKQHQGLVPAIGGMDHVRASPSISTPLVLPPTTEVPIIAFPAFSPQIKTYDTDPESLLPGVIDDLTAVASAWDLDDGMAAKNSQGLLEPTSNKPTGASLDVLGVLKITTRAIRSIRNYLVSLPDESAGTIRANFRPHNLGPGKPQPNAVASSSTQPDPLTLIRRSAVEVLTVLREMEENCRLPLSDDAYDTQSDGGTSRGGGTHSQLTSPNSQLAELADEDSGDFEAYGIDPDSSITFMQVQGRHGSVPVWEDEDGSSSEEEEKVKKEHWDERLVLGNGWLYRQDVTLGELARQKKMVEAYLDVVNQVLFGGKKDDGAREKGWERERRKVVERGDRGMTRLKERRVSTGDAARTSGLYVSAEGKRRVSTGMLDMMNGLSLTEEPESMADIKEDEAEESLDDEELPNWAQRNAFANDDLGRAHAILSAFLPGHLLPALEPPSARTGFLVSLSSGQLLCIAYNSCVRKSKKPWGYVNKDGIHDIIALEQAERDTTNSKTEGGKKGWTFRRIDNLRLWVGALKLRYMLPIQMPVQSVSSSARISSPARAQRVPSAEPAVVFDAKVVARKDDGWENMLESVLLKWVWKVVDERRSVR